MEKTIVEAMEKTMEKITQGNLKVCEWILEEGERYYFVGREGGTLVVGVDTNSSHEFDNSRASQGNCFKTKEEAQEKLDKILKVLKGEL